MVIAGEDGKAVPCCRDSLHDRGLDYEHFWLDVPAHGPKAPAAYIYCCQEDPGENLELPHTLPDDVLPIGEFFRDGLHDVLGRWTVTSEALTDSRITLEPLLPAGIEGSEVGSPACYEAGQALRLDTSHGFIAMSRSPARKLENPMESCVHLRAHFFDHGDDNSALGHWLSCSSKLGSASIGLAFGIDGCYSTLPGEVATCAKGRHFGWLRTSVERSRGWHLLELLFEKGDVHFSVDGEPVGTMDAGAPSAVEEIQLVSRCGGDGVWAGVELFHTPALRHSWQMGLRDMSAGGREPWKVLQEEGRWQVDDNGIMQNVQFEMGAVARITAIKQRLIDSFSRCPAKYSYLPRMEEMLGLTYRICKINSDGMVGLPAPDGSSDSIWWFPPVAAALVVPDPSEVAAVVEARGQAPADQVPEVPALPGMVLSAGAEANSDEDPSPSSASAAPPSPVLIGGLAIECWSIPGEGDLERMERVMAVFTDALQSAQVPMPDNIRRIQRCTAPQHAGCFVYNFGTKRMHVATRMTEAGRLLLVVRCGGGFIDFVEFARRHGSVEQLRIQKRPASGVGGREVVRLTSVLARGKVRARPPPSPPSPLSPLRHSVA